MEEFVLRLRKHLEYWVKHNKEHRDEFVNWAERTREIGLVRTANYLLKAAEQIDESTELLVKALKDLKQ